MDDVTEDDVGFLYKTMLERDPTKRRVKPVQHHLLQLDFGGLEDSSDDSDYEVKHKEGSEDSEEIESDEEGSSDSSEGSCDLVPVSDYDIGSERAVDEGVVEEGVDTDMISLADSNSLMAGETMEPILTSKPGSFVGMSENEASSLSSSHNVPKIRICCVCLGDHGEEDNEIVECDGCGVAVHEGCYGISDTQSAASTVSSASTEPWFCEACKAGVKPHCELCPNSGGIFKETDNFRWVHIVCALYIPGVAFGDVDKLSPVTLFEMPYTKWGAKECSLCEDDNFSCTGVCISCDAGMCRNYFHVTCAQKEGLLSEAGPEEEIADPFYAYCKQHVEKSAARAKRRNHLALQSSMRQERDWSGLEHKERARVQRKLHGHRQKYQIARVKRPPCWQPTEKMPRMLFSSPSATLRLLRKAQLLGIHTQTQSTSHKDIRKKWHVAAAFSTEYVSYYLDRNERITAMRKHNHELVALKDTLQCQENLMRSKYDKAMEECDGLKRATSMTLDEVEQIYTDISGLGDKPVNMPASLRPKKAVQPTTKKEVVKSAHLPSVIHQCALCSKTSDQHQLAKCDKCKLFYHLGCLQPPLTRMPKKTKLMGWQCSECAASYSEESEDPELNPNAPRRLREKIKEPMKFEPAMDCVKARRRSEVARSLAKRGRAKKKLSLPTKHDSPPPPTLSPPATLKKSVKTDNLTPPKLTSLKAKKGCETVVKAALKSPKISSQAGAAGKKATRNVKEAQKLVDCCVCLQPGDVTVTVKCDNCSLYYHFQCLDPPQTKSPRYRGYAWFCSACQEDAADFEYDDDDTSSDVKSVRPSPLRFQRPATGQVVITRTDQTVIKTALISPKPAATEKPLSPEIVHVHEIISSSEQSVSESNSSSRNSPESDEEVIILDEDDGEVEEEEEEESSTFEDLDQVKVIQPSKVNVIQQSKVLAMGANTMQGSKVKITGPEKIMVDTKAKTLSQEKHVAQRSKVKIMGRAAKHVPEPNSVLESKCQSSHEGSGGQISSDQLNVSPRSGLPSRVKRPMILSRTPVKPSLSNVQEISENKRQKLDF